MQVVQYFHLVGWLDGFGGVVRRASVSRVGAMCACARASVLYRTQYLRVDRGKYVCVRVCVRAQKFVCVCARVSCMSYLVIVFIVLGNAEVIGPASEGGDIIVLSVCAHDLHLRVVVRVCVCV